MHPVNVEAICLAPRRSCRRWVIVTICIGVLPLAARAGVIATAGDAPPKGRIRLFVAADAERAPNGRAGSPEGLR